MINAAVHPDYPGSVLVSAGQHARRLVVGRDEFTDFVNAVKRGDFDSFATAAATYASSTIRYLIWSQKHNAWWGPDELGHTSNVDEAGRYGAAEAARIAMRSAEGGDVHSVSFAVAAPENWAPAKLTGNDVLWLAGQVPASGHRELGPDTPPVAEQVQAAKADAVEHRHGQHDWHTHSYWDYISHQRPIDDEVRRG